MFALSLLHSREQDPQQLNDGPADQRVDDDGDQREELDFDALKAGRACESLEHPQERLCDEIDQAGKWILRVGCHQLQQKAQPDRAVKHAECELDQAGDAAQCLIADGEHAHAEVRLVTA